MQASILFFSHFIFRICQVRKSPSNLWISPYKVQVKSSISVVFKFSWQTSSFTNQTKKINLTFYWLLHNKSCYLACMFKRNVLYVGVTHLSAVTIFACYSTHTGQDDLIGWFLLVQTYDRQIFLNQVPAGHTRDTVHSPASTEHHVAFKHIGRPFPDPNNIYLTVWAENTTTHSHCSPKTCRLFLIC